MTETTMAGWRESTDPDELAAAVAAGVEVQWTLLGGSGIWRPSDCTDAAGFRSNLPMHEGDDGNRYRLPVSWKPEATDEMHYADCGIAGGWPHPASAHDVPEATDLRERVAKAIHDNNEPPCKWATCDAQREFRGEADAVLAELAGALAERDALAERLAAVPDVPDGHELVVLPSEVVDHAAAFWPSESKGHTGPVGDACRAAVARRPQPEPRTERVPWWEAVGRKFARNHEPIMETRAHEWGVEVWTNPSGWVYGGVDNALSIDGTVEVLAEGVES